MATNRSKRYEAAAKLVDANKQYPLEDAVDHPQGLSGPQVRPDGDAVVPPGRRSQAVRPDGARHLPAPARQRQVRCACSYSPRAQAATAARDAGAEFVGMDDMVKKCQEGFQDFDVAIATPSAMAEVRKLGKVLGPRGLMPNPKTGTVTDDTAKAIKEVKAGRVEFKLDKNGNVSVPVGKVSFAPDAAGRKRHGGHRRGCQGPAVLGQGQVHPFHHAGRDDVARCERGRFGVRESV